MWRSPEDIKPSLADKPITPTRAATTPRGKRWLKVFAPRTRVEGASSIARRTFEDSDVDLDMLGQPGWWRYLVAWLPWLEAASYWFRKEKSEYHNVVATGAKKDDVESGMQPRRRDLHGTQTFESDDTFSKRKKERGSFQ